MIRPKQAKQKVGSWQGTEIVIDWDDLLYYKGNLWATVKADQLLGRLLILLGVLCTLLPALFWVISGRWQHIDLLRPASGAEVVAYGGVIILLFASYLRRDRQKFGFNLEGNSLQRVRAKVMADEIKEIEVDSYFSYKLWGLLDQICVKAELDFLAMLAHGLSKSPRVLELMSRLGVEKHDLGKLIDYSRLVQGDLDSHIGLFPAAFSKAMQLQMDQIDERAIWLVLLQTVWKKEVAKFNVTANEIQGIELWIRNQELKRRYREIWEYKSLLKPKGSMNRAYTSRYTPVLNKFGEDYTSAAAQGRFEISIGKDAVMVQIIKELQKGRGAAMVLIGEPGVGKTHFLRHLGVRMVVEDVPPSLRDHRLVAFDFNRAFTESGEFEEFKRILQSVFDEVADSGDIVLVLDNLDQMLHVRSDLQAEIVSLVSKGINDYNLRVIGTASSDGYNRYIKSVHGLASMLQAIYLSEPDKHVSLQVLIDAAPEFESKYGVSIQVPAIRQIVELAPKFSHERVMPDKGIQLLEEAALEANSRGLRQVSVDIVSQLISSKVGVQVGRLTEHESRMLVELEDRMHQRVVGQDQAISAVANALRRSRAGLKEAKKPIASFMFFGPTGVGKTEVAKTLAEVYYGSEKLMIRIDMSEFQEEENVARLIGKQADASFTGGYLTEAVRKKPFSLILLDEIEKANPKVLDLLLQILDEGRVTDGAGRQIDFTNCIIIATSNAASKQIADLIGRGQKYTEVLKAVQPLLTDTFRIEFLNRFDKIIMFKPLLPIEVEQIADRMLQELADNLMEKGYGLEYTRDMVSELVKLGYNPLYGAREVRRVIQDEVENRIASAVINGELKPGGTIKWSSIDNYQITL